MQFDFIEEVSTAIKDAKDLVDVGSKRRLNDKLDDIEEKLHKRQKESQQERERGGVGRQAAEARRRTSRSVRSVRTTTAKTVTTTLTMTGRQGSVRDRCVRACAGCVALGPASSIPVVCADAMCVATVGVAMRTSVTCVQAHLGDNAQKPAELMMMN